LEEYRRKYTPYMNEFESLKHQYFMRLKETVDDIEKIKEERDDFRIRLESKEREQSKIDSKMKALEKVINTNNFRTPATNPTTTTTTNTNTAFSSTTSSNKENISSKFATPLRCTFTNTASGGSTSSSANSQQHITGTVSGPAHTNAICNTGQNTRTPITSTIRSETPITSTYRSSRIVQTTTTQSIGRSYGLNSQLPPHTPYKEGVPVANKRNQRRSKSAEMWLDHKPPNTAKLDTVMQPKMSRKKSVSKVELCDAKKSSKYVLTHQQQDCESGEVITNLIKGDILKSPSGGANVIFTDIETLNVRMQEVEKHSRKRISDCEVLDDQAAIQERCSIAIEGHANRLKNIKKTRI